VEQRTKSINSLNYLTILLQNDNSPFSFMKIVVK
jgi:hypothetical protein